MTHEPQAPAEGPLVAAAAVFYALMTAIAVAVIGAQDASLAARVFGDGASVGRDALLGVGAGLAVVALTWATRNLPPMRALTDVLAGALGRPSTAAIAVLSLTSAVGEELLFRGALQPLLGLWPTAVLFGVLHGGLRRPLRAWAVFATLAGVLLGWTAEFTGNLLAPILCHLTVNFWNLHRMAADHHPPGAGAPK